MKKFSVMVGNDSLVMNCRAATDSKKIAIVEAKTVREMFPNIRFVNIYKWNARYNTYTPYKCL